jgi:hypothetical protein
LRKDNKEITELNSKINISKKNMDLFWNKKNKDNKILIENFSKEEKMMNNSVNINNINLINSMNNITFFDLYNGKKVTNLKKDFMLKPINKFDSEKFYKVDSINEANIKNNSLSTEYFINNSSNKKNNISNYSENNNKSPKEKIKPKLFFSKQYEEIKIENLKNDFINGKYNEALLESKQNDKYLLELLPFMKREIIPKIEIAILEDCITRLNKRILRLCLDGDWEYISDILMFYLQLLNSKKKLKIIIKLSIKDAMNFLKSKGNNFLEENDINNIETIINTIVKA